MDGEKDIDIRPLFIALKVVQRCVQVYLNMMCCMQAKNFLRTEEKLWLALRTWYAHVE